MPVACEIEFERLTKDAFSEFDYAVMGHVFKCHSQLGRLADERIYEANLAARLIKERWQCRTQVPVFVSHASFLKKYTLDLVVSRKSLYELKTVSSLSKSHVAQLLNYLYLLELPRGKLVNFRPPRVESRFVNAPLSLADRTSFTIDKHRYQGDVELLDMTVEMLFDLGTSLSVALYQEILVHLLGGGDVATKLLPISDNSEHYGKQRFHLVNSTESLSITCFNRIPSDFEHQLHSLLKFSPLKATHWINIDRRQVSFRTITKD